MNSAKHSSTIAWKPCHDSGGVKAKVGPFKISIYPAGFFYNEGNAGNFAIVLAGIRSPWYPNLEAAKSGAIDFVNKLLEQTRRAINVKK